MRDRKLKLLKRFIAAAVPVSIQSLSQELSLSQRTIRNELSEMNEQLAKNEFPVIQSIRGKGMYLKLNEDQKKAAIRLMEEQREKDFLSRELRILDLILSISLENQKVFLYQKEQEYQISKSTMDEDMRRVRVFLREYGLEVISMPKQGLILEGKERIIRTMLYSVVNKAVKSLSLAERVESRPIKEQIIFKYLPMALFKKIDSIYDQVISSKEENFYRKNFILFTGIWLIRYQQENLIKNTHWKGSSADLPSEIQQFVHTICKDFKIQPEGNELNYLIFMLNTFNQKNMNNSIEWMQAQILSIQLIQHVEKITKIPFSRREEALQEGLYKHIAGLLNRIRYDIQFANPLKENIKASYQGIYGAVADFAPEINNAAGKKITEDELAFLAIHFSTSASELNQEESYYYRAVVICNHGVATGKLLAENLKELFNIEVLAVLSSRETDLISKLDIDLVFATLSVPIQTKPTLIIDPIIKKENKEAITAFLMQHKNCQRLARRQEDATHMFHSLLHLIERKNGKITGEDYQELENIFLENHLSIDAKEIQPMIKDVLKDENILVDVEAENWQEAIRLVSQPLLKEKIINQQYIEAMIEAVKKFGPYIVIGRHLALAHARPEDGAEKLGLSVAVMKKPIYFGHEENDPVTLIFCLSAVDSYSHLNIMKNLIDLINDEDKINRLSKAESITAFKEVFFAD
ncbi:BglG family transcription antiterminator [Enterococcus sp. LJL128]